MADFYAQMTGGAAKIPVKTPDEKKIEWVHGLINDKIERARGTNSISPYPPTSVAVKSMSLTAKQLDILCQEGFEAYDSFSSKKSDYDTKIQVIRWNHNGKVCEKCPRATIGKNYDYCNQHICSETNCPYEASIPHGKCTSHRG